MGHRPSTRRTVGEMLFDDFEPYHEVNGRLVSIFVMDDGDRLVLNFEHGGSLHYVVNHDDDTLYWRDGPYSREGIDLSNQFPWNKFVGRTLFWAWLTMNKQGYIDGALLSFDDLLPALALTVIASSLKVSVLGEWQDVVGA